MDRPSDSDRMRADDDRGFFDRAEDEVRSWFGDDDAEHRRERDHRHDDARPGGFRGYDGPEADRYRRNYDVGDDADRRAREGYSSGRFFYETDERRSRSAGRPMGGSRRSAGMEYRGEDRDMGSGASGSGYRSGGSMGTSHAGRGPSGYSRSAERVTEDVNEALMDDHDVDATHVRVSVEDGEVTLEGTVASRSQKRRAEDVAERCRGVRDVHNRLRIEIGTTGGVGGMGISPDMAGGTATPGASPTGTSMTGPLDVPPSSEA